MAGLFSMILVFWERENRVRMMRFSQRKGLKPVAEVIQTGSMNSALRNSLWNVVYEAIWSAPGRFRRYSVDPQSFSKELLANFFKEPIDLSPMSREIIRAHFFGCKWFEVYDFLEFVVGYFQRPIPQLAESLNSILERESSGYRFVSGLLTDITNAQEREMLETALTDSRFPGVDAHLQRALELYANRENPDYRNSIKESISAVERMAGIVSGKPKATLGDALKEIGKREFLHPALKDGFSKLYGYTSDAGIRHAMLDEPNLTAADALYFLLSCTSFINYLKAKIA